MKSKEAENLFNIAYDIHYNKEIILSNNNLKMLIAYYLYGRIVRDFPGAPEVRYSKSQIDYIERMGIYDSSISSDAILIGKKIVESSDDYIQILKYYEKNKEIDNYTKEKDSGISNDKINGNEDEFSKIKKELHPNKKYSSKKDSEELFIETLHLLNQMNEKMNTITNILIYFFAISLISIIIGIIISIANAGMYR